MKLDEQSQAALDKTHRCGERADKVLADVLQHNDHADTYIILGLAFLRAYGAAITADEHVQQFATLAEELDANRTDKEPGSTFAEIMAAQVAKDLMKQGPEKIRILALMNYALVMEKQVKK